MYQVVNSTDDLQKELNVSWGVIPLPGSEGFWKFGSNTKAPILPGAKNTILILNECQYSRGGCSSDQ